MSRVTLWTTCGPVRYHGTVCSGNIHPDRIPYVTMVLKTESVLLLLITVFIACLLKGRLRQWQSVQQEERLEVAILSIANIYILAVGACSCLWGLVGYSV
jgi:hypothetical protein